MGSILTPHEQNTLLCFNRLNLILHILPNELFHALNIGIPNGVKASAGSEMTHGPVLGSKVTPGTHSRDYF